MIAELPSRASTQSEIDRTNRHMDRIESEGKKYAAVVEVGAERGHSPATSPHITLPHIMEGGHPQYSTQAPVLLIPLSCLISWSCPQRKRKQYALLFHVIDELQRDDTEAGPAPAAAAAAGDTAAMEVDG